MAISIINHIPKCFLYLENNISNLSSRQKKVAVIALAIFVGLAVLFLYRYYCRFTATRRDEPPQDQEPVERRNLQVPDFEEEEEVVADQIQEGMPITELPLEIQAHILSFVREPLLIGQVCREWRSINQELILRPLVEHIENYWGEKRTRVLYQETLSDAEKLYLLLRCQKLRLFELVGKDQAIALLNTQPAGIDLARFIACEQWIKDYNLILMCNKIDDQQIKQQTADAIEQVKQQRFDIAPVAQQLRDQMAATQFNQIELELDNSGLTELPSEIRFFSGLRYLILCRNRLIELPSEIGSLTQLEWLDLTQNILKELPPEIGSLTRLAWVDFSDNQLSRFPAEIRQWNELIQLFCRNNQLIELPPEIGQLNRLHLLYLDNNQLTELPREIVQLAYLGYLSLIGNPLSRSPARAEIQSLLQRRVRIAFEREQEQPAWNNNFGLFSFSSLIDGISRRLFSV